LKAAYPGPCITVTADEELQSLRDARFFMDIDASIELLTNMPISITPSTRDSIDFDHAYVSSLSNSIERNESLLNVLKRESATRGRIILYATTAENARLFAGLLPVLGIKARSVTTEDNFEKRALAIQKFVAREERVLCVHGFLLSGTSVPDITTCIMALPSKSRAAFLSTVGRLVQARPSELPPLRLIVAADTQADADWVVSLNTWSALNT